MTNPDPRRTLYTFHWLSFRQKLQFDDSLLCAAAIRELGRYIGACPPHDPEFNRVYRAMDLIAETIGELSDRKKRTPEQSHCLSLLESYHRQLCIRYDEIKDRCPIVLTDPELRREMAAAFTGGQKPAFEAVKASLEGRFKASSDPALKEELHRYLSLMDEVDGTAATAASVTR